MTCTTNKHIIIIPGAVKAVTVGKAPPPFLTAHYTGVGWMFTMDCSRTSSITEKCFFTHQLKFCCELFIDQLHSHFLQADARTETHYEFGLRIPLKRAKTVRVLSVINSAFSHPLISEVIC